MSRRSGRNAAIFLDNSSGACQNMSGDVTSMTFNGLKNRPDTTNMGADDIRRELDGIRDATFDVSMLYSHGTGACPAEMIQDMHAGTAYRRIQYFPEYQSSSSAYVTASAFLNSYAINSPVDGVATISATFELASNKVLTPEVYAHKVLDTDETNLIGYWPLWDVSASTNDNREGTAARDGSASNVLFGQTGIGDGRTSACFDGTLAFTNIYSTSLNSVWDGTEFTINAWTKITSAAIADGNSAYVIKIRADDDNQIYFRDDGAVAANQYRVYFNGASTVDQLTIASQSSTDWIMWTITLSVAGDYLRLYKNGILNTEASGIGTWSGALDSGTCVIGGESTTPATPFNGQIAHVAVWKTPLTAAQILNLASV